MRQQWSADTDLTFPQARVGVKGIDVLCGLQSPRRAVIKLGASPSRWHTGDVLSLSRHGGRDTRAVAVSLSRAPLLPWQNRDLTWLEPLWQHPVRAPPRPPPVWSYVCHSRWPQVPLCWPAGMWCSFVWLLLSYTDPQSQKPVTAYLKVGRYCPITLQGLAVLPYQCSAATSSFLLTLLLVALVFAGFADVGLQHCHRALYTAASALTRPTHFVKLSLYIPARFLDRLLVTIWRLCVAIILVLLLTFNLKYLNLVFIFVAIPVESLFIWEQLWYYTFSGCQRCSFNFSVHLWDFL